MENNAGNELVDLQSHGLPRDEPLTVESIIKGCFSNPDRTKFPRFFKREGEILSIIDSGIETPDSWIGKIRPELVK